MSSNESNQPNRAFTESFFQETLPDFFAVKKPGDITDAYNEYAAKVTEIAGPRGENASQVDWTVLPDIAQELDPLDKETQRKMAWLAPRAAGMSLFVMPNSETELYSTGPGSLLLVDAKGNIKSSFNEQNPAVNPSAGIADPYVLEKLGWAKVVDVLSHKAADKGEGYVMLTDFLRGIKRIKADELPHVGMATAYAPERRGLSLLRKSGGTAFASASHFTFDDNSVGILSNFKNAAILERDTKRGLVGPDNMQDWLAGRLDSQLAYMAAEWYQTPKQIDKNGLSIMDKYPNHRNFPDLTSPDYVDVDNN